MSIQSPDTEESNGKHSDTALRMTMRAATRADELLEVVDVEVVDVSEAADVDVIDVSDVADVDVVVVSELAHLRTTTPSTSAPRRASDYRLRGLDLDAQGLAESREKPERKLHPSFRRRRRRRLVQLFVVLIVLALAAVVLRATVVQPFSVTSTSMVPTLPPGSDVLVVKPHFLTRGIDAGDIVVFKLPEGATFKRPDGSNCSPSADARHLVSRVIALPGQTIWSEGENIYIDGVRLDEPDWRNPPFGQLGTTTIARTEIPSGSYFVMGDNRTDTCDSRLFGPVPGSLVVGQVVATTARDGHPSLHFI